MGSFKKSVYTSVVCSGVILLLFSSPLVALSCDSELNPHAFQVTIENQENLLPNGMMAIRYAATDGEFSPHVSVHRVMMVVPGRQSTIPEAHDSHFRAIEVDGTIGWVTYLIAAHALFYGMGQDSVGFPERMWADPQEDGLNGNERPHGNHPLPVVVKK